MRSLKWIIACLTLFVLSQSRGSVSTDLVQETCHKTTNYDLCVSSLKSDPRSSTADAKGLARIALDQTLTNSVDTQARIARLFNETSDEYIRKGLGTCKDEYDLGVGKITEATKNVILSRFVEARNDVADVADEVNTCEESFSRGGRWRQSPLTDRNNVIVRFAKFTGEIIAILG
ncbi:hypothetical protein L3X38_015499 [Prunus dulcis]|uniref:Pectinesterase inhibitor domain-containing protein n=1 Tax=Prunus dulcis TaxID=3755 RepID=A0AAD4Z7A8_PRUDU|nr:hypothetical protein L3X38_015499 [Prunus dulcis]